VLSATDSANTSAKEDVKCDGTKANDENTLRPTFETTAKSRKEEADGDSHLNTIADEDASCDGVKSNSKGTQPPTSKVTVTRVNEEVDKSSNLNKAAPAIVHDRSTSKNLNDVANCDTSSAKISKADGNNANITPTEKGVVQNSHPNKGKRRKKSKAKKRGKSKNGGH